MRTPLLLYVLALVVRAILIATFPDPAYPDSAYYVDVARALHAGHGFNVDFVWIFAEVGGKIPASPVLPIPSNGHWMPLASIVQVPFLAVFGTAASASAAPFAIVGALAAPLTWAIAREAGARREIAVGAGVLVALPVLSTVFMAQPDNFSLYQPLVAGSLWMAARGLKGSPQAFILAGLLAGFATLARNDGLLVLAVLGLAVAWDRWRAWRSSGARRPQVPLWAAAACVAVFIAIMAPWWARQLSVFGNLSPSTASGKVLFIRSIDEWNSITTPATLDHLLGMGLGPLLATRVEGLVAAVFVYATLVGGLLLTPFMLVGAWLRRRSVDFGPFFAYAIVLFAFSAIVSAVHVPGGTFIHSAVALAPHSYILALEGIAAAIGWVATRRRTWNEAQATTFFVRAAVVFAVVVAVAGAVAVHGTWSGRRDRAEAIADALATEGAPVSDRVMSIDASSTKYWTGHGGVVLVDDPLDTIEQVAAAYDIRWLVVDRAEGVDSTAPLLAGERPAWVGPPSIELADKNGQPRLALFPVCLTAGDDRCPQTRAASR